MPKASKFSPDEGITIYDLKDNEAVHWADNTKIGAHNLCPYPFKQSSATNRGVTFTDNGNGTLTLNNANDNTGDSVYQMHGAWASTKLILPPGVYTVTTGNANANIYMSFSYNETNLGSTLNGNKTINAPNGITYIVCSVKKGATVTNETVYPLIRISADLDETYADYTMTNKQLTNEVNDRVLYADNAILGAKNLNDDISVPWAKNNNATFTVTDTGVTTVCTAKQYSGVYKGNNSLRAKYGSLPALVVSFEYKSDIACAGLIGTPPKELQITLPTEWTSYSCKVDNPASFGFISIYNMDATKTPTISVRNFMIRLATDTDNTYHSPTMTNAELTTQIKQKVNSSMLSAEKQNNWTTSHSISMSVNECVLFMLFGGTGNMFYYVGAVKKWGETNYSIPTNLPTGVTITSDSTGITITTTDSAILDYLRINA